MNDEIEVQERTVVPVAVQHSGIGITSFIIAASSVLLIFMGLIMIISVGANTLQEISNRTITEEELLMSAPLLVIGGLLFLLSIIAAFVGGILGIAGLIQKKRKRIFAILGTIINWLIVLFIFFAIVTSWLMQV